MVHDPGSTNLRLWKKYGIDPTVKNICSFPNPCADRDIFVFADAPHLIKLIRNNFLDSGFHLNCKYAADRFIREMMSATKTEYSLHHKLSEQHLNVCGPQRRKVKYAVQLLSGSCAKSLRFLGKKGVLYSQNWNETDEFISLVEWFDIMNSSRKWDVKRSRNAFGTNIDHQIAVLDRMTEIMSTMRVGNPKTKGQYNFQKGVILLSQSLTWLYKTLKSSFSIDFILTRTVWSTYLDASDK